MRRWLGVNIDVREAVERETELRRSEAALRERDLRLRDTVAQLSARTKDLGQANQQLVDEMAAREQTRAALLASEQRFRDFADLGSDWMWETDSDGRFNYFSTAKIHGTPTTEFIGKTRDQIGILDHSSVAHRDYEADLAARLPVHDRVITVIGDGGSVRHARMNARPIFGARGCFHGYRGVGRDITARIEAERSASDAHLALRKSEARFRRVVEDAPNAIVVVGISGTIEMINARTEQMFGHAREALIGQNIATLIPERHRDGHPALFRSFLADLTPRPMGSGRDLYALRRDGGEFPIEIALNPIETEDGLMVLATITDITDRRQKEERIQAALKEKDVLLSEIHHRVKNNLQVVQSLLFLQSGKIADAAAQEALRDCQNRVQSMALIHQTLYASQDFARVNFNPFLNELISSLRKSNGVDRAPIGIRVTAEPIPLPLDTAMPCGLIVNELITNALKHAFKGRDGGEIEVALVSVAPGEAMLSVADDGIGIPDNFNIEDATSLGLQLVLTLADQVGGSLTVNRNNPTQFALRFPIDGNQAVGTFSEKSSPS